MAVGFEIFVLYLVRFYTKRLILNLNRQLDEELMMKTKTLVFSFSAVVLLSSVSVVSAANLNGQWTGSPTCQYSEFNDNGSVVMWKCNNSGFHHLFEGQYANPSVIQGRLTRVDLGKNCRLTVPASITIMGDNQIQITQYDGWNGCGVATGHGQGSEIWTRAGDSVGHNAASTPYQPSVTQPGTSPHPSGQTIYMSPELGELVTAGGHANIEGGYGEANVRLDRGGNLYADLKAKSESNVDGVHAAGFVIGLDRRGRMLFVSEMFDPAPLTWTPHL